MFSITQPIPIPESELAWKFVRSGGPGGQNVNKVASKAVLFWDMAHSTALPEELKARLAVRQKRFLTKDGVLVIAGQKYRDQERNRTDCLEKLRAMLIQALQKPKSRKATKRTRGSHLARLAAKKHRAALKSSRRAPGPES